MKDDEKKSQREDMQFPDEEDMDFEILDALEQLDQGGPQQSPNISDETIELTLDDDDMNFGDNPSEAGSSFSFDDSLREGLEQELLQGDAGFDIDESLEDDLVKEIQTDAGEDPFALSLDLDEELSSQETDAENDDSAFDLSAAETQAFNYNKQDREARMRSLEGEDPDDIGSYDLDLGSESDDIDLESFSSTDEDFPELDLGIEGVEISEEFADLGADIDFDSPLDQESENEDIPGKAVITVGDDEVIDLGDEENLLQKQPPDSREPEELPQVETEAEISEPLLEEEAPSDSGIALDLHEEDEEDFMDSFGDIAIDLQQEADESSEDLSSFTEEEGAEELPVESEDMEADRVVEDAEMADLVKEVLEAQELEKAEEEPAPSEDEKEPEAQEVAAEPEPETEAIPEENIEAAPAEEIDVREFLDLSLRLSDEQIEEFEAMVNEAKTLQTYLDELEEHHSDVKENIYHKLQVEYIARKTVIFKSEEFTSLLSDVERDLEDMLAKRTAFVETVERLNEELEEIKVRHLVGEFNDSTLSEKQESQNAEIALWNEKTEKIEVFITRYQESLDAEKALNPLRQEQAESPMEEESPKDTEAVSSEDVVELAEEPEAATAEDEETFIAEEKAEAAMEEEAESLSEEEDMEAESDVPVSEPELEEEPETHSEEAEDEPDIENFFATSGEEPEEDEELDEEFPMDGDFETGDFVLDDLSGFEEDEEDDDASDVFGDDDTEAAVEEEEAMVTCSKCGRQTSAAEKFCVHCGGKAQKAEQDANVPCKKCGRQTPAAEKFCVHCGGKAQ